MKFNEFVSEADKVEKSEQREHKKIERVEDLPKNLRKYFRQAPGGGIVIGCAPVNLGLKNKFFREGEKWKADVWLREAGYATDINKEKHVAGCDPKPVREEMEKYTTFSSLPGGLLINNIKSVFEVETKLTDDKGPVLGSFSAGNSVQFVNQETGEYVEAGIAAQDYTLWKDSGFEMKPEVIIFPEYHDHETYSILLGDKDYLSIESQMVEEIMQCQPDISREEAEAQVNRYIDERYGEWDKKSEKYKTRVEECLAFVLQNKDKFPKILVELAELPLKTKTTT